MGCSIAAARPTGERGKASTDTFVLTPLPARKSIEIGASSLASILIPPRSAPASPDAPGIDCNPPSPTSYFGVDAGGAAFGDLERSPTPTAPQCLAPDPAYVLTARVWRDLPRQFWPSWRAAVRPAFTQYLTATESERPNVISLLLGLPAALLPPRVGGRSDCQVGRSHRLPRFPA